MQIKVVGQFEICTMCSMCLCGKIKPHRHIEHIVMRTGEDI